MSIRAYDENLSTQRLFRNQMNRIQYLFQHYRLNHWGFVVYRSFSGHDDKFSRLLSGFSKQLLDDAEPNDLDIYRDTIGRLQLTVVEDPILNGASKEEIRRRFREWVKYSGSLEFPRGITHAEQELLRNKNPRYAYCIHIDEAAIQSYPEESLLTGSGAYVNVIRADDSWTYPEFSRHDWHNNDSAHRAYNVYDEQQVEIEGSRLYDVGWMKYDLSCLLPDLYVRLGKPRGWYDVYRRPNVGVAPAL